MFIAVLLALMLGVTTFALITSMVEVKDNHFDTGVVKINLNDGNPVISEDEYLFEPGMRVVKDFFIKNEGSIDAYYKIYLEDVKGDLADVLQLTIREKGTDKILYQGTAKDLTRGSAAVDEAVPVSYTHLHYAHSYFRILSGRCFIRDPADEYPDSVHRQDL